MRRFLAAAILSAAVAGVSFLPRVSGADQPVAGVPAQAVSTEVLVATPAAPTILIHWAPGTFTPGGALVAVTVTATCGDVAEGALAAGAPQLERANVATTPSTSPRVMEVTLTTADALGCYM